MSKFGNDIKFFTDEELLYKGKQVIAMRRVNQAIKCGTLKKPNECQVCGKKAKRIIAHHYNGYDNPLSVWFVCSKCNYHLPHDIEINIHQAKEYVFQKFAEQTIRNLTYKTKFGDWAIINSHISNDEEIKCRVCDNKINSSSAWLFTLSLNELYKEDKELEDSFFVGGCCIDRVATSKDVKK